MIKRIAKFILPAMTLGAVSAAHAQKPDITATDLSDAIAINVYADAVSGQNDAWTPTLAAVPSFKSAVNFSEKFIADAQVDFFIHNWGHSDKLEIMPFQLWAGAHAITNAGNFGVRVGHIIPDTFCIQGIWGNAVPIQAQFHAAFYTGVSNTFPRAILGEWNRGNTGITIGYAEIDNANPGFAFNGTNPAMVAMGKTALVNGNLRIIGILQSGKTPGTEGALYIMGRAGEHIEILANCAHIGKKNIAATGGVRYPRNKIIWGATGIYQRGGVYGAYLSGAFRGGIQFSIGATGHDPRYPDIHEIKPTMSIGYVRTLSGKSK